MTRRLATFVFFGVALVHAHPAAAQYTNKTGNVVGTIGGTCSSTNNDYGWPDTNGNILKCVSSVWTLVTAATGAAGSTGYVQYNSGGALAGSANLFWNNSSGYLGIGTTNPTSILNISGSLAELTVAGSGSNYIGGAFVLTTSVDNYRSQGLFAYNGSSQTEWFAGRPYYLGSATSDAYVITRQAGISSHSRSTSDPSANPPFLTILNSGNVGIGTTVPQSTLGVSGGVAIGTTYAGTNAAGSNNLIVQGEVAIGATSAGGWALNVATGPSSGAVKVGTPGGVPGLAIMNTSGTQITNLVSSGNYVILANTSAASGAGITIDTSGDLGVGLVPANKLDVNGSAAFGTYAGTATGASNELIVGGNVGIGTTSPSQRLDLGGGNISMGYEIDTNTVPANSSTGWYYATCSSGKQVLGGACTSSSGGYPTNTTISGTTQYGCYVASGYTSASYLVQAVCANIK